MSWSRALSTGHGAIAWRASIDGLPYDPVSHPDMVFGAELSNAIDTATDAYNLLPDPGTLVWTPSGSTSVTTGIADPVGGTNAVTLTDPTNALNTATSDSTAYTAGNDLWASIFVKRDSAALNFAEVRIDFNAGTDARLLLHLRTGATSVPSGSFEQIHVRNVGAWWFVALKHAGDGAAATVRFLVSPARGLAASFPTESADATGSVTVYGARIADATDEPVNADPVSGLSTDPPTRRLRYDGLRSDGLKLSERVHLPTAAWEAQGLTLKIADVDKRFTYQFTRKPTAITHLAADWTAGTSITVDSTADFPTSGKIYLGFQTVDYTSTDATHFLGCSGQQFNTPPLKHYIGAGSRTSYPEVTNWPRSIEGRRVRIYAYGAGDDKQGDGTQIWVGIARSEPRFNGVEWTVRVDPLSGIFDFDLNADLEEPYSIRGIYYSFDDPLLFTVNEMSTAASTGSVSATAPVMVCGFWETQAEFCEDLTAHIQDVLTNHATTGSFTQLSLAAVPDGDAWRFQYTTTVTAKWLRIRGGASGGLLSLVTPLSRTDGKPAQNWVNATTGAEVETVANSTAYTLAIEQSDEWVSRGGTVPRATLGYGPHQAAPGFFDTIPADNRLNVSVSTNPGMRVYLTDTPLSTASSALITWTPNGTEHEDGLTATCTVNTSSNYLDLTISGTWDPRTPRVATAENPPEIRIGRELATGNLFDLLSALQTNASTYVTLGAWPFIHNGSTDGASADIETTISNTEIDLAAGASPMGNGRVYSFFAPCSLRELIEHECRLIGVYPCYSGSGQIVFRRLRHAAPGEASSNSITSSSIVVDDKLLSYERSPEGLYNTVEIRSGYNPVDDEHANPLVRIRDLSAYAMSPTPRTLQITLKSQDPPSGFSYADAVAIASRVLAVFGAPYSMLTIEVPLTLFSATLGTVVDLTWTKIPDGAGDLGVTSRIGIVAGREWKPQEGRGTLTILVTDQRIGGYAPGGKVTSITGASGGTGPFTATLSSDYFPSGTTAASFFEAGDAIRLFAWDNTSTANNVTTTVTSVSGNVVTFSTAGAWTHAGTTWALGAQVSTSISAEGQKAFCYLAASTGRVEWASSDFDDAFTLA